MRKQKRFYSDEYPQLFDSNERLRIAKQLLKVMSLRVKDTRHMSCLDLACSGGIMSNYFSRYFRRVIGIDIDRKALKVARGKFKRSNLKFIYMDAQKMSFRDSSFDVVFCNQVYQFVEKPESMFKEVYRILTPDGIFIITGPNILSFFEAQTKLPLLHFLPNKIAAKIVKIFAKEYHTARYKTYFGMKNLLAEFKILNATPLIIKDPDRFEFKNLEKYKKYTEKIPLTILKVVSFLSPNFILVCEKRNIESGLVE